MMWKLLFFTELDQGAFVIVIEFMYKMISPNFRLLEMLMLKLGCLQSR